MCDINLPIINTIMPRQTATAGTRVRGDSARGRTGFNEFQHRTLTRRIRQEMGRTKEQKHYDVGLYTVDAIDTADIALLTGITQGDTDLTRDGDRAVLKSVHVRMHVTAAATSQILRVIYFRWNQSTTDTIPTTGHILESATNAVNMPYNWDNLRMGMFKILSDRTYYMPASALGADKSFRTFLVQFYPKRFGKKPIQFDNTTVTGTGHIYQLIVSDKATSNGPSVKYYSRAVFTDS